VSNFKIFDVALVQQLVDKDATSFIKDVNKKAKLKLKLRHFMYGSRRPVKSLDLDVNSVGHAALFTVQFYDECRTGNLKAEILCKGVVVAEIDYNGNVTYRTKTSLYNKLYSLSNDSKLFELYNVQKQEKLQLEKVKRENTEAKKRKLHAFFVESVQVHLNKCIAAMATLNYEHQIVDVSSASKRLSNWINDELNVELPSLSFMFRQPSDATCSCDMNTATSNSNTSRRHRLSLIDNVYIYASTLLVEEGVVAVKYNIRVEYVMSHTVSCEHYEHQLAFLLAAHPIIQIVTNTMQDVVITYSEI
jgi:hypothetical protein